MRPFCAVLFLVLSLAALACSGAGDPAALGSGAPAASEPIAAPRSSPTPALSEPHVTASRLDGVARYDSLTFYGWSEDGSRYAYETWFEGQGANDCEGEAELVVVDASKDEWLPGAHRRFAYEDPTGGGTGVCSPKDLRAALALERGPLLRAAGIITGLLGRRAEEAEQGSLEIGGRSCSLLFSTIGSSRDALMAGGPGASYRLALQCPGADGSPGEPRSIEDGQRRRPGVFDYALAPAWISPDRAHAALFIEKRMPMFEGARHGWMSNGVALPGGPPPR